jgi:hypothetical protein
MHRIRPFTGSQSRQKEPQIAAGVDSAEKERKIFEKNASIAEQLGGINAEPSFPTLPICLTKK